MISPDKKSLRQVNSLKGGFGNGHKTNVIIEYHKIAGRLVMETLRKLIVSLALFTGILAARADVANDIERLVSTLPAGSIKGIEVKEADSGKLLYALNSGNNLLPASTLKTLTAFAAYEHLGADFRFQTRLLSQRKINNRRTYHGHLALEFNGDPSLRREDLAQMLGALAAKGVHEIYGNIWLDNSAYDGYPRAGGTSWDDQNICFAAPSTAIIVDGNCFFGWLEPAKNGQKAVMKYDHPEWRLEIDNQIVTRSPKDSELLGCVQEVWPSQEYEYRLEGCIRPDNKPMRMAFSVRDVERTLKRYVKSYLKNKGVQLKGRILVGRPPVVMQHELAVHESLPLPALLEPVLEKSDNLYSDSLLKTLGRELTGGAGSYYSGTTKLREIFVGYNVPLSYAHINDGSGLSRYNLISPEDMNQVLMMGWQQWGEDAPWLLNRDKKEYWLKTGYMNGVNNMAGYVFPESDQTLIFTVILNGLRPEYPSDRESRTQFHQQIREFHRAFLEVLVASADPL